jgi:HK97 family phage prohead protease
MNKPTITGPEKRSFTVQARASQGEEFVLVGRAASFNTLSSDLGGFREMLAVGCFDRSLNSGDDIKALHNHNADVCLATRATGTLQLSADTEGLNFRCQLNKNIQAHRDVYETVKSGLANQCSFAFTAVPDVDDDWGMETDSATGQQFVKRTIRNLTLFEISCAVTFPAYTGKATATAARATKAADEKQGDALRRRLAAYYGTLVGEEGRALEAEDVSSNDDFMSARFDDALAKYGYRYADHDDDYVYGCGPGHDPDSHDADDCEDCCRWAYQIDEEGSVILDADSASIGHQRVWAKTKRGQKLLAELRQRRIDEDLKRRMKSAAGIFH